MTPKLFPMEIWEPLEFHVKLEIDAGPKSQNLITLLLFAFHM